MLILVLIVIFLLFHVMRYVIQSKTMLCKENLANIEYYISLNRNYSIYISGKQKSEWGKVSGGIVAEILMKFPPFLVKFAEKLLIF